MKRLVLVTAGVAALASFGCAVTDYPAIPSSNKSHGLVGCASDDRIANSQQVIEPATRELLYTAGCVGTLPAVTLDNVTSQDARDWNRFLGTHSFFGEAGVTGTPDVQGMYVLASVKDLPDGSVRINNYFGPDPFTLSCVGAAVDGRFGGPEGVIAGDALGRQPGLTIDSVALDRTGGATTEFCGNVTAMTANRAINSFSTYWSLGARAYEGRLEATPITRREGLAGFLAGQPLTVTIDGVSLTGSGRLEDDGTVTLALLSVSHDGHAYQADEPILVNVNPAAGGRTSRTTVTESELVRLGRFAIEAGLTDRTFDLGGRLVPELGLRLPDASLLVSGEGVLQYVDRHSAPVDGGLGG